MFPTPRQTQRQRQPQQRQPQQGQPQGGQSFREGGFEARVQYIMRQLGISREEAVQLLRQRMASPGPQTMQRQPQRPQRPPRRPPVG